jgi:hypothetical protein
VGSSCESHFFGGFAFRKRVRLQLGQRLRVEPRVLSSCADPHLEQTYVPWPGFVPARATAHLPVPLATMVETGEGSRVRRPTRARLRREVGRIGQRDLDIRVLGSHRDRLFRPPPSGSQQTWCERIGCRTNRRGVGPNLGPDAPAEVLDPDVAPSAGPLPATMVPVSLDISTLGRSLEPR